MSKCEKAPDGTSGEANQDAVTRLQQLDKMEATARQRGHYRCARPEFVLLDDDSGHVMPPLDDGNLLFMCK